MVAHAPVPSAVAQHIETPLGQALSHDGPLLQPAASTDIEKAEANKQAASEREAVMGGYLVGRASEEQAKATLELRSADRVRAGAHLS